MNWITLGDEHFNLDRMNWFCWINGVLYIMAGAAQADPFKVIDPDRAMYGRLCKRCGIKEVEP
jgi:hypothetical protein